MPRGKKYATEAERKAAQFASIKRYRARNKEKVRSWRLAAYYRNHSKYNAMNRRYKLRAAYGMADADYEAMLANQNGVCAICYGVNPSGKKLAVDHCHVTQGVRGLLCTRCNTCIGHARESAEILDAASAYIRKFK